MKSTVAYYDTELNYDLKKFYGTGQTELYNDETSRLARDCLTAEKYYRENLLNFFPIFRHIFDKHTESIGRAP